MAFSDSGFVYLIDLGSRHGTHILHPGDIVSRMLDPEVATMLGDGDIVTFGKTVGKGSYIVPPVTARVELLFDNPEHNRITSTAAAPRTPVAAPEMSRRPSSGRYGLFVPSSLTSPEGSSHSSDDDSSSKYDHDSDIEEIAPPTSYPERESHSVFALSLPALPNLRSLAETNFFGPDFDDFSFGSSLDGVRLPAIDRPSEQSRSHSPMELSSPTPTPVGAWPSPSTSSPSVEHEKEACSKHVVEGSSSGEEKQAVEGNVQVPQPRFSDLGSPHSPTGAESMGLGHGDLGIPSSHRLSHDGSRSPSPPSEFDLQGREKTNDTQDRIVELNATIIRMQREIADAITKCGPYQPPIDDSARGDELLDLRDRVAEAESLSFCLDDRLDATEDDVFSLREHVTKLQEQADALKPALRDGTNEALAEVKAGVAALNTLVSDMRTLHENMEKQMSIKLASVEAARSAFAAATSEAQTMTSLKRKRSETEAEEQFPTSFGTVAVQATGTTNDGMERPRCKRAKRIVSTVMHTATAMTIGAVATWSALAFS
jgi:hypothetical protein